MQLSQRPQHLPGDRAEPTPRLIIGPTQRRTDLRGDLSVGASPRGRAPGWHPVEWLCEAAGTAFQLTLGFSAVAALECPRSPLYPLLPPWARLAVIGACFGLLAGAVAISPLGRRSGAHLNPAVTVGFALRGHTTLRDVAGFVAGQTSGALAAAAIFWVVWGSWARAVKGARTQPSEHLGGWAVAGVEISITAGLLLAIFAMVSSPRTARWTPAVVTGVLTGLIVGAAPLTGASMNPARTLGPDAVTSLFPAFGSYVVGPLAGAGLAVLAFAAIGRERRTLTAKLFHDPDYPSVHATELPARPHREKDGVQRPRRGSHLRDLSR